MAFPETTAMDFTCDCPIDNHKNVWDDVAGVRVRYCPTCLEQRVQYYTPTERWEDTGRGAAGDPIPADRQIKIDAAAVKRAAGVVVENPRAGL